MANLSPAEAAVWIPAGQTVFVGGFTISDGLFYLGRPETNVRQRWPEPSLVDASLSVDARMAVRTGTDVPYGTPYSDLTPVGRAAYLRWLATGRCAPDADINYVFLYFFGLERRVLVDGRYLPAAQREREVLTCEIRRLMSIYGSDQLFAHFANELLAVATPIGTQPRYLSPPPTWRDGWDLPFDLRLGIGQLIIDGKPIPPDWALSWVRLNPEAWLRTPATRCADEFAEVFLNRYRDKYGEGIRIEFDGAMLRHGYYPASSAIAGRPELVQCNIPNVAALEGPFAELREIARAACTDLDEYSRYLGRHPEAEGTAAAFALLPQGLKRNPDPASEALPSWANDCLGSSDLVAVAGSELIGRWPYSAAGKLTRSDAAVLARLLERYGVGLEPDVRFGGPVPASQRCVVLFRCAADAAPTPGGTYAAAVAVTQLAAVVATADGSIRDIERTQLERRVTSTFGLGSDERCRLRAYLAFVLRHPPMPGALRNQAETANLTKAQQRGAAELLVAVACADGVVTQPEVDALAQLFPILGLDPAEIHSLVNLTSSEDALTPLRIAGNGAQDYVIPQYAQPNTDQENLAVVLSPRVVAARFAETALQRTASAGGRNYSIEQAAGLQASKEKPSVVLDPELIAARLVDSARAASYLAQVFADEDIIPSAPSSPERQPDGGHLSNAGLDAAHSQLLRRLALRPQWTRREFDTISAELSLLPDGALDTINEAAVDVAGEPICEGADPIQLNRYAVEEMLP